MRDEEFEADFSPDGKTLISGAKDGGVFLWPIVSARETPSICARSRSSCARSSGVYAAPKSSASKT